MRDDAAEIRQMLEDRLESVLDAIAPGWARRGNTAYLTPKGPKDLGSFTVSLRNGQRLPRGCWHRFSQHIGGGIVELVAYQLYGRKDAYREAFDWSRRFLGLDRQRSPEEEAAWKERQAALAARRAREQEEHARKAAEKKLRRAASAAEVWAATVPLAGTPGDSYLQARGLAPVAEWGWNPDECIRFHPALDYEMADDAGRFPAVVGKVVDAFGELTAVWQIYLDREHPRKAALDPNKVGRGPATGGAIRIGGDAAEIDVAEGMESALGAWELIHRARPCWSLMSTSGMSSFEPPAFVKKVRTWPDGDPGIITRQQRTLLDPPGIRAARALNQRLSVAGIPNPIHEMTRHGDALDMLVSRKAFDR